MSFISILFDKKSEQLKAQNAESPPFFIDLNLDQVVDAIASKWSEYNLNPFFYLSLNTVDSIHYRHEVFKDLENELVYEHVKFFAEEMQKVKNYLKLVEKLYYQHQKEIWFLYAVEIYCETIKKFSGDLNSVQLKSRGLVSFKDYLQNYIKSKHFTSYYNEVKKLNEELAKIKYRIIIQNNSFTVQNYEPGINYSDEIEKTFQKFKQGAVKDYRIKYDSTPEYMNPIEAQILNFVAQLNSGLFSKLENFYKENAAFIDETIEVYDREIHFYIAYLEHIEKFKQSGLKFCYPVISETTPKGTGKEIYNYEGFDLALANKLNELSSVSNGKQARQTGNGKQVVCNDFYLEGEERIIVITGPNQGGKTTFARVFGQIHYLASLGCPVPGSKAQLFHFDNIFTQFERSEKVENLRGKLEDDLTRIYSILEQATSRSIIIMNEIFNSTTIQDVSFLSTRLMERILELDTLCVWVTFVDELASFNEKTVSMTSNIVPDNPALRTFKIVRRQADGLAYALAIAEKYRLTYSSLKNRIMQ